MSVLSEVNSDSVQLIAKESDDLFLDLVKSRPCLYDKKVPEHHNKIFIENAMEEIAFVMNDTVENCEKRWKKFQSAYNKEKMLEEQENRSGSGASKRKKWPYYERMKSFINSSNDSRPSYTNVCDLTSNNKRNEPSLDYQKRKKRKNDEIVASAFNTVQNQLNNFIQYFGKENDPSTSLKKSETGTEDNCSALVGKLVESRLNELSPTSAKKKRKMLMKCLIDDDSEDSM